jgi:putative transposase
MTLSSSNSLVPIGTANLTALIKGKAVPHKALTDLSFGVGVHLVDLTRGQIIRLDGIPYIFTHATTDDAFCMQHERTGKMLSLTMDEIAAAHREGRLVVEPRAEVTLPKSKTALLDIPFSAFARKTREDALSRARYCHELDKARANGSVKSLTVKELEPFIARVAKERNDPNPPKAPALIRWHGWWRAGKRRLSVLCHGKAKRHGTPRLKQLILYTLWDVLESYWATGQNVSLQNVQNNMRDVLEANAGKTGYDPETYSLPALSTISLYAKRLNKYQVTAEQDGVYEANRLFEPRGKLEIPTAPNVLWEVDHHRLKYEVSYNSLDRNGNEVEVILGRPWLTLVIDVYSRVTLSVVVSFEPPRPCGRCRPSRWRCCPRMTSTLSIRCSSTGWTSSASRSGCGPIAAGTSTPRPWWRPCSISASSSTTRMPTHRGRCPTSSGCSGPWRRC